MEEREEETDVEIETTPETKGTFMIEVSILVSTGVETVILLKWAVVFAITLGGVKFV